jgi:hypothetical protein
MFYCNQVKKDIFAEGTEAKALFEELRIREKEFTYPARPVLFDDLEKYFMRLGLDSPHMYYHKSPGILRLKAKSGVE